jgi:hypothetical protein
VNVVTRFTPETPDGSVIVLGRRKVECQVVVIVRAMLVPDASVREVSRFPS